MASSTAFPAQHQQSQPGKEHQMNPQPLYIREDYRGSDKLRGKVVLITGGDSGIGRAVAVHAAREGAHVAIVYKPEEQTDAEQTQQLIKEEGRECLLLPGDIREAHFCQEAVETTVQHFGKLNVLVNNAAEQHPQESLTEVDDAQMTTTFETNVYSFFRFSRAALPHLQAGDSIINTSSVTGYEGHPQLMDYAATNGAITAFTRSLATNLAAKDIRVNGVAPGPIWTPLIPASFPPEKVETFGQSTPMERAGQPCEVATCFVFLASQDASYLTGQMLHPNGGRMVNG